MKNLAVYALALFAFATQAPGVARAGDQGATAFDFDFVAINGQPMPLSAFRGKVLLVVNTASLCGYTSQYEALQALWEAYRDRGLVVIGVPSNDFGNQEPEDEAKIAGFCKGVYGVTFPLTSKTSVRGKDAHPFYRWASSVAGPKGTPRWNFHKFLIAADGRLAAWFPTATAPDAQLVKDSIEAELSRVEAAS